MCEEHTRIIELARVLAAKPLRLERMLSGLVNKAYGLTAAEAEPMWKTAPPSRPIPQAPIKVMARPDPARLACSPLRSPVCRSLIRVIVEIDDPRVAEEILRHLGAWHDPPAGAASAQASPSACRCRAL